MEPKDISSELWREYEWLIPGVGQVRIYRTYRIQTPETLFVGKTTHRIVDQEGVVHLVPSIGELGCCVRWRPRDPANPVQF
jgi:hypothetical protein